MHLEGYKISYQKPGLSFSLKIALQLPKILKAIFAENRWLKKNQEIYHWDAVISDNRFGLYHQDLRSVFITHQVNIKTGLGSLADKLISRFNHFFLSKFNVCWIPDTDGKINLAGELSHGSISQNAIYIGPLSRFSKNTEKTSGLLLIILSGPEPQRSMLEKILEKQLSAYPGKTCIVRGKPGEKGKPADTDNLQWYNHLPVDELQALISSAELVICRSGYSTIMDLAALQKKAILIPTPGQAEQEYLGAYLMEQEIYLSVHQGEFNLQAALEKAERFPFKIPLINFDRYKKVIDQFIND